jgi:hypothetical protein
MDENLQLEIIEPCTSKIKNEESMEIFASSDEEIDLNDHNNGGNDSVEIIDISDGDENILPSISKKRSQV